MSARRNSAPQKDSSEKSRSGNLRSFRELLVTAATVLALSGCGQAAFDAQPSVEAQKAPGTYTIPAKVDFVLAEDDMGSMFEAYPEIDAAMPNFLTGLQSSGWDYHFAAMPLTTLRSFSQVVGSEYDYNWYLMNPSAWLPSYPGQTAASNSDTIPSYLFSTAANYEGFINESNISNTHDGKETGFYNLVQTLYDEAPGTNVIRPDAMLVVLVVSNMNDTSNVNLCTRSDGEQVPCEQVSGTVPCTSMSQANQSGATCQSAALSLNYYQQMLQGLKPSGLIKFYAAVANENMSNCQGGGSSIGVRYQEMAGLLGGQSYDICQGGTNAISTILSELSSQLTNVQESFVTKYLLISQAPNVSTIVVTRNDGTIIPESSTNGWSYAGQISGYTIVSPVNMNAFTNQYAIQLNGSYMLSGNQSATVSFTPAGLQNSH